MTERRKPWPHYADIQRVEAMAGVMRIREQLERINAQRIAMIDAIVAGDQDALVKANNEQRAEILAAMDRCSTTNDVLHQARDAIDE